MSITIKFCPCNFEDELENTKEILRGCEGLELIEERCLLYCGQCLIQPFALVNGENIVSEEPDQLFDKINQFVTRIKQEANELLKSKFPRKQGSAEVQSGRPFAV